MLSSIKPKIVKEVSLQEDDAALQSFIEERSQMIEEIQRSNEENEIVEDVIEDTQLNSTAGKPEVFQEPL